MKLRGELSFTRIELEWTRSNRYLFQAMIAGMAIVTVSEAISRAEAGMVGGLLVGLAWLGVAIAYGSRAEPPNNLVFNGDQGVLELREERNSAALVRVPYTDIREFRLRASDGDSETPTIYHVDMERADGAIWALLQSKSKGLAELSLERLQPNLATGTQAVAEGTKFSVSLPSGMTLQESPEQTEIAWRLGFGSRRVLGYALLSASLLVLGGSTLLRGEGLEDRVIPASLLLIGVLSGAYALQSRGGRASLTINRAEVQFQQRGLLKREEFTQSIQGTHAIRTDFSGAAEHNGIIWLLDKMQLAELNSRTSPKVESYGFLSTLDHAPKIPAHSLGLARRLVIEGLMRNHVERLHGSRPL